MIKSRNLHSILALVQEEPGLSTRQIAERVFISPKYASSQLSLLKQSGSVVSVRAPFAAFWATPEAAGPLREALAAAAKIRKTAGERASRRKWIEPEDDGADTMPRVVIKSHVWEPVRAAPGPISVFNLGVSNA